MHARVTAFASALLAATCLAGAAPAASRDLQWCRQQLQGAYERTGQRDAMWDRDVAQVLDAMAVILVDWRTPTMDEQDVMRAASTRAEKAGCADPLFLFATGYNKEMRNRKDQEVRAAYVAAARRLDKTAHHPMVQWLALLSAAEWDLKAKGKNADAQARQRKEAQDFADAALALTPRIAADRDIPLTVLRQGFDLLGEVSLRLEKDRMTLWSRAMDTFVKDGDPVAALTLQAEFMVDYAWDARGRGYADTVTPEMAEEMDRRLTVAAKAAEEAWRRDDTNTLACVAMMHVELGLERGRDHMEAWFRRAMAADPACWQACRAKITYLLPKWHGSADDVVRFGRECERGGNWDAGLPLFLVTAHLELAGYETEDFDPSYFRQTPGAWDDVRRVYDEYLRRVPDSTYHRSRYANIAHWAGHPEVARQQLELLKGKFSYRWFRNQAAFDRFKVDLDRPAPAAAPVADDGDAS